MLTVTIVEEDERHVFKAFWTDEKGTQEVTESYEAFDLTLEDGRHGILLVPSEGSAPVAGEGPRLGFSTDP